ncbi:hypothetical protein BC567DRAFT_234696, partial [Phyllosticta citribraziliensis]
MLRAAVWCSVAVVRWRWGGARQAQMHEFSRRVVERMRKTEECSVFKKTLLDDA